MGKQSSKPTLEKFIDALEKTGGNISLTAKAFGLGRSVMYNYINEDENFKNAVEDARGKMFDECLATARVVALGVPLKDEKGRFIGWQERPDGYMLRYLMGIRGKKEGFGDSVDVTSNGKTIKQEPIKIEIIR